MTIFSHLWSIFAPAAPQRSLTDMTYDSDEFWSFVNAHIDNDVATLRLRYHGDAKLSCAITQIECRQRFGKKLAQTLHAYPRLVFGNELCGEQSTSDALAEVHVSLLPHGSTVTDLTAGLGIDAMHTAIAGHAVTACERDEALVDALRHNAAGRALNGLRILHGDSVRMLHEGILHGDVAFIDPARRGDGGRRLFGLTDCVPDVVSMLDDFRRHFKKLIIKASPMIDIRGGMVEPLECVTDVYAIGTTTQCKELVAVCDLTRPNITTGTQRIHSLTLLADEETSDFSFEMSEESGPQPSLRTPKVGDVVYEPYPSVMKCGGYRTLAYRYGTSKIAADTHLYASDTEISGFPGQAWRALEVLPWQSRVLKRFKNRYPKISVAVRNFDMAAAALQSRLGVKEGDGHLKLIAVTLADGTKALLVLER